MFVFEQSGCIRAKWFYSGESGIIRAKLLYSGKVVVICKTVVFGKKWLDADKSGSTRTKVVVF